MLKHIFILNKINKNLNIKIFKSKKFRLKVNKYIFRFLRIQSKSLIVSRKSPIIKLKKKLQIIKQKESHIEKKLGIITLKRKFRFKFWP